MLGASSVQPPCVHRGSPVGAPMITVGHHKSLILLLGDIFAAETILLKLIFRKLYLPVSPRWICRGFSVDLPAIRENHRYR
jgi:hypothetical protein